MSKSKREPKNVERGRWSSPRKMDVVLRLLRGDDLDALSREFGVTPGRIAVLRVTTFRTSSHGTPHPTARPGLGEPRRQGVLLEHPAKHFAVSGRAGSS